MRKYTGFDGYASGKRKGTEEFVRQFVKLTGGAFFHNGSYGRRAIRGGNAPSVHGTGRAVDLSYRGGTYPGCGDRKIAEPWIQWLVDHADDLQLEIVVDYMGRKGRDPFGRGWRCDRDKWQTYLKPTVTGGGKSWADWIHVEVAPAVADDSDYFRVIFAELTDQPSPEKMAYVPYPGKAIRRGCQDKQLVMKIQKVVGAKVDGVFGAQTERKVMEFQAKHGLTVDGWIGEKTWSVIGSLL